MEVHFSPAEIERYNARTDREEHETILSPFIAFTENHIGDWHSIATPDATDEEEDAAGEAMIPDASRYVIELISDFDVKTFREYAPYVRVMVSDVTKLKLKWPFIVTIPADLDARDQNDLFKAEEAWIKANAKRPASIGEFDCLYGADLVHFGFEDQGDAALFKLFFGGA